DDVFMSVVPAPFGFGLWTAHFTPTIAGRPCVLVERFTAEAVCAAIEQYGVTVLAAVSTQFVMMLNSAAFEEHDLSSLRVLFTGAGRASDVIIRGGKNLSAAVIEDECATMPGVLLAAAVAKPDPVFGERVCVFCAVAPGARHFSLDELLEHLDARDFGKELWPEHLAIVEGDLPRSSGGKVAKGELRAQA